MPHNLTIMNRVTVKKDGLGMSDTGDRTCLRCGKILLYLIDSNTHICVPCKTEYSFPEHRRSQVEAPPMRPYERYDHYTHNRVGFVVDNKVEQRQLSLYSAPSPKVKRLIYKKRG